MYVLYNFYGLHEMVKYEEFCESSYVGEFHANHSVKQKRDFLCARNWKLVSNMQHIKTIEKLQELLVFKIQLLRKYLRKNHPIIPTKGNLVVSKEVITLKETKKKAGKLLSYLIDIGHKLSS